jgi:hypothetical protein
VKAVGEEYQLAKNKLVFADATLTVMEMADMLKQL